MVKRISKSEARNTKQTCLTLARPVGGTVKIQMTKMTRTVIASERSERGNLF